jgi:hypothetical protein
VQPSALTTGGLILDIAGALILALGLVVKTPEATLEEATPRWDFNVYLDASLATQTADAQVGATLLSAGFALQMGGALGWHIVGWSWTTVALVVSLAVAMGAFTFLRHRWRPRKVEDMLFARLRSAQLGQWSALLISYAAVLGEPPIGQGEVMADFAARVIGIERWNALIDGVDPKLLIPYTHPRSEIPGTAEYAQATRQQIVAVEQQRAIDNPGDWQPV